jgi:hypothetical protein
MAEAKPSIHPSTPTMVIYTNEGMIKVTETPRWSDYHKRYYAAGYRWISLDRNSPPFMPSTISVLGRKTSARSSTTK